jgi:hypothetical protein
MRVLLKQKSRKMCQHPAAIGGTSLRWNVDQVDALLSELGFDDSVELVFAGSGAASADFSPAPFAVPSFEVELGADSPLSFERA